MEIMDGWVRDGTVIVIRTLFYRDWTEALTLCFFFFLFTETLCSTDVVVG